MSSSFKDTPYYGYRREKEETPVDSPYRGFIVQCVKCKSIKVKIVVQSDESGESAVLVCKKCGAKECVRA